MPKIAAGGVARLATSVCVSLLVIQLAELAAGQASDGDDQFQAFHHDIERITSNGAQVAARTTLVNRIEAGGEQVHDRPAAAAAVQVARSRQAPVALAVQQPPAQVRKPNRVVLAVRRDPSERLTINTQVEPALVAAQLPQAPAVQHHQHHQHNHQHQPLEPTFAAVAPQPLAQPPAPAQPHAQPSALASFRASQGSVSARHSALIAQVAAERAAISPATDLVSLNEPLQAQSAPLPPQPLQQFPQPSLGSPLEALSSPAAQVQAPASSAHRNQLQVQQPAQFAAAASSQQPRPFNVAQANFVNLPEEPIVAPSFEHVLSNGCPPKGVFSYENKDHCDRYYICTNGTFTEEACPNGLAYGTQGAVYQHCAYNWNVDCGAKKSAAPIASPGCPWQFGLFPIEANGRCSIDYFVCEWGVPETKRCSPEGLFYDDRIKGCQWADQLGCKSEALLQFKCPAEDEENPYWPYPRYYHNQQDVIVCVNEQPRLVHCNEEQLVDPASLACVDVKKKKKKF